MASSPSLLPSTLVLLLLFFLSTPSALLPVDAAPHRNFTVELLHRDSPGSPFYNSSATPYDRVRAAAGRSVSRAQYLKQSLASSLIQSGLIMRSGEYLMSLSLGTPPVKVNLIVDTGSSITWTRCVPCGAECSNLNVPLFDPTTSSTYKQISCDSQPCKGTSKTSCSSTNNRGCQYDILYGDLSTTQGILSSETFLFDSSSPVPNLVFGCSHSTKESGHINDETGILGLNSIFPSVVTQLGSTIGSKFSYCLLPFLQASSSPRAGSFSFGVLPAGGASTPLYVVNDGYYVDLEAIVVGNGGGGEKNAAIGSSYSSSGSGNILVDSGTTNTYLDPGVVGKLEKLLSSIVKLQPANYQSKYFRLCFQTSRISACDLPDITFQFKGGATMKLSPINTFAMPTQGVVCLAILPSTSDIPPVVGNLAQQNFHVGFDLQAKALSFAPKDCANA